MVKTKRRANRKGGTQKVWRMKGCAKKKTQRGGCGCGSLTGGSRRRMKKGGRMWLSPSPFVNKPWLAPIQAWPGVQGSATGNWLTKNQHNVDVTARTAIQERNESVFPPKLSKGGARKKKGGVFNLVNMARSVNFGVDSAFRNLVGSASMPKNPAPTADQFSKNI